jgi:hypothetical protein
MNNGMKTTEEEEQQQQKKSSLWMQWNERANKNCPKRVPKHLQDPTKTQFHKKLVTSVKIVNT